MEKKIGKGGQRMITVIAYLNDVEEGGETGFPEIGINITTKKRRCSSFS
jgi:prolyl 4-hydroxylase